MMAATVANWAMMLSGKKSLSPQAQVINIDDPKIKVASPARLLDLGPYLGQSGNNSAIPQFRNSAIPQLRGAALSPIRFSQVIQPESE
ncbi:hypothetical protein LP415_01745 [Polaromonas sp. P1(28)-8]|nr:hypothetical protein LP415_01745 [Polaromonas sp. P1(28)-8]